MKDVREMNRLKLTTRLIGLIGTVAALTIWASIYLSAQNIGTPMPVPQQIFDNLGNPCSSCTIATFVAGTSTSAVTYTDVTLATPASNPITLDSVGRTSSPIYLDRASYKFVISTSANVLLVTWDNVPSAGQSAYAVSLDNKICDGRISVTSGTAIPDSDVTAATSIYF